MFIHSQLRPHQQETLERIQKSDKKFVIIEAPTGSGKSFHPAQLAAWGKRTLALVRTKSLQTQYARTYNFAELFGKGNYPCLGYDQDDSGAQADFLEFVPRTQVEKTADLCEIHSCSPAKKILCQGNCEYPQARQKFLSSIAGTLNTKKFLLDRPLVEQFHPAYLFLDEAHEISDTVVDFAGLVLRWNHKYLKRYLNPLLGRASLKWAGAIRGDRIDLGPTDNQAVAGINRQRGQSFLQDLYFEMKTSSPPHPMLGGDPALFKWHKLKLEQIDITLAAMDIEPEKWFVYADDRHFVAKPVTARFHFKALFDKAPKLVLMSATIGNPVNFTRELGIQPGEWEFIEVPNVWPGSERPILDLKAPKLGYRSPTEDWDCHAKLIANAINRCPDHWTGIIHTPSKKLAWDLSDRLLDLTGRPIWNPEDGWGTERAMKEWLEITDNGALAVTWNFWEGIDAGKDNICIVAKVPFVNFADPFDKARFRFDGAAGNQRTANKMVQGLGRTRRGRAQDYGKDNGLVAIADGHWSRFRKYINQGILKAIQ